MTARTTTLDVVFPPRHVYVGGIHPGSCRWLPFDDAGRELASAGSLPIAGELPVVCHAGVATPAILDLMAAAGHPTPQHLVTYRTPDELVQTVRRLAADGYRLVIPHAYPPDVLPPTAEWMPRTVATALNDKGRLAELVPARYVPHRTVIAGRRLAHDARPPVVCKVATDETTGGGSDVRICRTGAALAAAADDFGTCERVVVEELLPMTRSVCANALVHAGGRVEDVGVAEQRCDDDGRYVGNWLDDDVPAEAAALAGQVAAAGAARGYVGVVGIDIGILADGSLRVFDLNFRLNGCTAALIVKRRVAQPVGQLRSFIGRDGIATMLRALERAMRAGLLLPLVALDPSTAPHLGETARARAIVLGASRAEVTARLADCAALGLV